MLRQFSTNITKLAIIFLNLTQLFDALDVQFTCFRQSKNWLIAMC